ncbi:hypothetical protein CCUS01_13694 [Colletotrichum cuscutae]|uniref:Uncharacterized protein n=1 Tax=Colletotrichum cuscutae TaxID=1209917 RepID=A0AAI9YBD0_9PEZI|nr:hypothetical protein CCUS01_13694 [Colletotrichum cuscutae]
MRARFAQDAKHNNQSFSLTAADLLLLSHGFADGTKLDRTRRGLLCPAAKEHVEMNEKKFQSLAGPPTFQPKRSRGSLPDQTILIIYPHLRLRSKPRPKAFGYSRFCVLVDQKASGFRCETGP